METSWRRIYLLVSSLIQGSIDKEIVQPTHMNEILFLVTTKYIVLLIVLCNYSVTTLLLYQQFKSIGLRKKWLRSLINVLRHISATITVTCSTSLALYVNMAALLRDVTAGEICEESALSGWQWQARSFPAYFTLSLSAAE